MTTELCRWIRSGERRWNSSRSVASNPSYLIMSHPELASIARTLVAPGKGILAADESTGTITKRLQAVQVESSEETRRSYREMLFTAPGLGEFISGVILYDETLRQSSRDGTSFVELLQAQGILPGIKVDGGTTPLAGFPDETVTEGLDGLRDRLAEYRRLGARFTKWRAVIAIGPHTPTATGLQANAHALARFAALSQEAGLVPIVEPEVLMDGDHTWQRHYEVTLAIQRAVFAALAEHHVRLEGILLKPNMVLSGTDCREKIGVAEVAEATLRVLRQAVPPAVPGVVFLSGGQKETEATEHLDALNRHGGQPWELSFSFGRALQETALRTWSGDAAHVSAAHRELLHRARYNSAARLGRYSPAMEQLRANG
jgi:fructose-bisphosphate aldolase, class I